MRSESPHLPESLAKKLDLWERHFLGDLEATKEVLILCGLAKRSDFDVEGREWVPHPEKRYSQCYEFGEALVLAIPRVIANIMRDIPQAFSMQPNSIFRKDIPLIPDVVIRGV